MTTFDILPPEGALRPALQQKIDNLAKPRGSLGRLEEIALRVGLIQQTLSPSLRSPENILFAADHGIECEAISPTPREVTWQQTMHFLRGGSGTGIGFLCRQHGFRLRVVDAGVDYDFPAGCGIVDRKVRRGTSSYLAGPAMSQSEFEECLEAGAGVVDDAFADGCNVVSFGEMGVTNTSSSALWMHWLTGVPLAECIGAGSGLDEEGLHHKLDVLTRASENFVFSRTPPPENRGTGVKNTLFSHDTPLKTGDHPQKNTKIPHRPPKDEVAVREIMARFGGFEMVMAVGGMLRAAQHRMVILVDGFIMTACMLAASRLHPHVLDYAIFAHEGDERGHRRLLAVMNVEPILSLGLRLGEGSGAVCAWPVVDSAVRMINEMASFGDARVTKYF